MKARVRGCTIKKVSTTLSLALLLGLVSCGDKGQYDDESDFRVKPLDGGKSVEIIQYVGKKQGIRIPPRIHGMPVTSIGTWEEDLGREGKIERGAFEGKEIISVIIPSSVTTIGKAAFANNELTEVIIPNRVTIIGDWAFFGNQLANVTIGNRVTIVGSMAFAGNQLTDITIPNSVITIGHGTFAAFANNPRFNIPHENVVTMSESEMEKLLNRMDKASGDSTAGNRLISTSIGKNVGRIGNWAFFGNQLANVTIPNNVTMIGVGAFGKNQLTKISVGKSVDTIGHAAFADNQLTNVTIPNNVRTIGNMAFAENQLTNVTISNGVIRIGLRAFMGSAHTNFDSTINATGNRLTSLTIHNSVTTIEDKAFVGNQLTEVTIGNSVTTIGSMAFAYNQLTDVAIPSRVAMIGYGAFVGNPLTNFSVASDNTTYTVKDSFLLDKNGETLILYYGREKNVTIPDSVTIIENFAFMGSNLTGVIIPNSVSEIREQAFSGNKLTSISIPNSVTKIGDGAFERNQLTRITIPNSITTIKDFVFAENQLTNVIIPSSVRNIGEWAFAGNQLTSISIGANVNLQITSFGRSFYAAYNPSPVVNRLIWGPQPPQPPRRIAGTYTLNTNNTWTRTAQTPEHESPTQPTPEMREVLQERANIENINTEQLNIEIIFVKGGTFTMGCTPEQGDDCAYNEKPAHRVTLCDFYIGKYPVTQAQWVAVMGNNPSHFTGNISRPVEQVSWHDAQEFISRLNLRTGKKYRLLTEAEWEYAARGGVKSRGYKYAGSNNVREVAWYNENSGDRILNERNLTANDLRTNNNRTHPVGTKKPNELGIYDMSGNVWEWVSDWYGSYTSTAKTNPTGPASGTNRVDRGGRWRGSAEGCRVSRRGSGEPSTRYDNVGFRLALTSI